MNVVCGIWLSLDMMILSLIWFVITEVHVVYQVKLCISLDDPYITCLIVLCLQLIIKMWSQKGNLSHGYLQWKCVSLWVTLLIILGWSCIILNECVFYILISFPLQLNIKTWMDMPYIYILQCAKHDKRAACSIPVKSVSFKSFDLQTPQGMRNCSTRVTAAWGQLEHIILIPNAAR